MFKNTAKIEGMMCSMCEAHISDTIRKTFPKAKKVTASHLKGEARFVTDERVPAHELARAIKETGYTFVSLDSEQFEKKGLFGRIKNN